MELGKSYSLEEFTNMDTKREFHWGGSFQIGDNPEHRIGLGVLLRLIKIPKEGEKIKSLPSEDCAVRWLEEYYIPLGLVRETKNGSGVYVKTDRALTETYHFIIPRC